MVQVDTEHGDAKKNSKKKILSLRRGFVKMPAN